MGYFKRQMSSNDDGVTLVLIIPYSLIDNDKCNHTCADHL